MEEKRPKVGVGVFIRRNGKILMGKRKNAHGDGTWAPPGGHLEYKESFEDCARREVREETGLEISNISLGPYTNDIFEKEDKHYITLYILADSLEGEPQLLEPHKCERWEWVDWESPPMPMFLTMQNLKKIGFSPFK